MLVFPPVEHGRWGEETLGDENQWPVSVQVWRGGGGEGGAVCGCGGSDTVASSYGVNTAREWSCNNHTRTSKRVCQYSPSSCDNQTHHFHCQSR